MPQAKKLSLDCGSSSSTARSPSGWSVGTRTEPAGKVQSRVSAATWVTLIWT